MANGSFLKTGSHSSDLTLLHSTSGLSSDLDCPAFVPVLILMMIVLALLSLWLKLGHDGYYDATSIDKVISGRLSS